jgi:hypothetical protein
MRKLDGMSLIFINFCVPALTPRLNSTETSLQLSENVPSLRCCEQHFAGPHYTLISIGSDHTKKHCVTVVYLPLRSNG